MYCSAVAPTRVPAKGIEDVNKQELQRSSVCYMGASLVWCTGNDDCFVKTSPLFFYCKWPSEVDTSSRKGNLYSFVHLVVPSLMRVVL